jgi:hypothetical protein
LIADIEEKEENSFDTLKEFKEKANASAVIDEFKSLMENTNDEDLKARQILYPMEVVLKFEEKEKNIDGEGNNTAKTDDPDNEPNPTEEENPTPKSENTENEETDIKKFEDELKKQLENHKDIILIKFDENKAIFAAKDGSEKKIKDIVTAIKVEGITLEDIENLTVKDVNKEIEKEKEEKKKKEKPENPEKPKVDLDEEDPKKSKKCYKRFRNIKKRG